MKRIILIILFGIFCIYATQIKIDAQDRIIRFFNENGIEYLETNVEYIFTIKSKINLEDIEYIILSKIGKNATETVKGNDYISAKFDNGNINISINKSDDLQLLRIFYSQQSRDMNIIEYIRRSVDDLNLVNEKRPSFYSLIEGKISYKLSKKEKINLARQILKRLYGREINLIEDDRYISLIGYSNCYNNNLKTNGKVFNVNIAVRDGSDGCTYILIGNPIITVEY
ncbi:hypothetical protein ABG79_00538 [Caloramator mitchellensis]|uniref:TATA-box binding protein n=1 Tax=Caloramator mitchellensis TaxID=908809 RepID=A0A0R3K3U3_CALMK|nr:YwmB family TATA-box binding protein [Caloramator mitchellensis]KRQ87733.1 hypothetical protein ABG79_00538 [Caloramator mitchellensis]